ncbi:hypothetical protein BLNAU_19965 [Blattamonas nauphoetae]|uniref:Uncharacterized protein n=1 Tax=Blattamonas nauphoetae TaxID=2049346 RepID=A0ABQ9X384_9EUKA|nr:hypothetical protein BLNAU_19965 [Blattamonas nauphoetae]
MSSAVSLASARLASHSRSLSFYSPVQNILPQDRDSRRELSRSDCHLILRGVEPAPLLEDWLRVNYPQVCLPFQLRPTSLIIDPFMTHFLAPGALWK